MHESNTRTNNQPNHPGSNSDLRVEINCLHDIELDNNQLCDIVRAILIDHQVINAEISIAVVDDQQIHELNRQYLNHDYETDVLSFNLSGGADEEHLVGEVIVSADTAARCASERSITPLDELALYLIHGTLHLVGFDDKDDESRKQMRSLEKEYAGRFGLKYCDPDLESPGGAI